MRTMLTVVLALALVAAVVALVVLLWRSPAAQPQAAHEGVLQAVQLTSSGAPLVAVAFADGYCALMPLAELQSRSWVIGKPHQLQVRNAGRWPNNRAAYWLVATKAPVQKPHTN